MARCGSATRRCSSQAGCTTHRTSGGVLACICSSWDRGVFGAEAYCTYCFRQHKLPDETSRTGRRCLRAPSRRIGYVGQILNADSSILEFASDWRATRNKSGRRFARSLSILADAPDHRKPRLSHRFATSTTHGTGEVASLSRIVEMRKTHSPSFSQPIPARCGVRVRCGGKGQTRCIRGHSWSSIV